MARYHINPETGNANVCTAKINCKFASSDGVEPPHYATKLDAQKASEETLSSTLPTIQSLKNDVEIKSVGDLRSADQVKFDAFLQTYKVADLNKAHNEHLEKFQGVMRAYDNLPYETSQTKKNEMINEALHMSPILGESRKNLLKARSQLNEEYLILQHKTDPKRANQRRKVLSSLNPQTQNGKELHQEMLKAFEDSEKELELSKRATDNLVSQRQNGSSQDSSTMNSTFVNKNDLQDKSHRMIQHARALQKLSELTKSYEAQEAKNLKEKTHLAPLQATNIERLTAESMTPSQIETHSKVMAGMDRNMIYTKQVIDLESQRGSLPVGDPMRDQINHSLRKYRSDIKRNREQYANNQSSITETEYQGFIQSSDQ